MAAVSGSGSILDDTLRGLERHDIIQGSEGDASYMAMRNDEQISSDGTINYVEVLETMCFKQGLVLIY